MAEFRNLPFPLLREPELPVRSGMDDAKLRELEDSIRSEGILVPLIVCPGDAAAFAAPRGLFADLLDTYIAQRGAFDIIAGHRRYKASKVVGVRVVPCMVHPTEDLARYAIMITENACREDVSPAEEARFFAELIEKFDYTEEALLAVVRRPAHYVYSRLALLRGDPDVLTALEEKRIGVGVAQQLNKCKDEAARRNFLRLAIQNGATESVVRQWVQQSRLDAVAAPTHQDTANLPAAYLDPATTQLECVMCGPVVDPYNLQAVYVHKYELQAFLAVMRMMKDRMAAGVPLAAYGPGPDSRPQPPPPK